MSLECQPGCIIHWAVQATVFTGGYINRTAPTLTFDPLCPGKAKGRVSLLEQAKSRDGGRRLEIKRWQERGL